MSDNDFNLQQERDRLQTEVALLRVERDTGVPVSLLTNATTEDEARVLAAEALAWRGNNTPAAQTPAPQTGSVYGQVDRQALSRMSPQQVAAAHKMGRLEGIGAPAPVARKTGERNSRHI